MFFALSPLPSSMYYRLTLLFYLTIDCGTPRTLSNGQIIASNGTTFKSTAALSCATGYKSIRSGFNIKNESIVCQPDGHWSDEDIECQPIGEYVHMY